VNQIDDGINKIIKTKADSLLFVHEFDRFIWDENHFPLNYSYRKRPRTQEKEWEMVENGDYIFTSKLFKETKLRLGGKIEFMKTSKISGTDIDTPLDLEIARAIAQHKNLDYRK
jgi:CMP-N-acetylneuraminic acid synthetase